MNCFSPAASSGSDAESPAYSERSLAIIKPEAFEDAEAIEDIIRNNGFAILARRVVHLTPEQAAEFYRQHYGRQYFPHLVAHLSSAPLVALVLAGPGAVARWRTLMGPTSVVEAQAYWPDSIRASFGRRTKFGDYFNAVHGSASYVEAVREIHFFFPNMVVGPILRDGQVNDYVQRHLAAVLLPATTALVHERPAEPVLWLAEYLRTHNPNEPEILPQADDDREERRCHTPSPSEETVR